jgi:hypothetical protein
MTVHIAFANSGTALLASDSQASDNISEIHGLLPFAREALTRRIWTRYETATTV